jgi:hypothetical protein
MCGPSATCRRRSFRCRSPQTLDDIRRRFDYIFNDAASQSSRPKLDCRGFDESGFELFGLPFLPVRLSHGDGVVWGFRFGPAAYLTDHSDIPGESMEKLNSGCPSDGLCHKPTDELTSSGRCYVERLKPAGPDAFARPGARAPRACCPNTCAWPMTGWKS